MVYDNYGNIKSKNGTVYTYGNSSWKDLLTKVGNQEISYDNQGNPITYLGHTLTWEKGRQLKSFGGNSYTYNANGIRTSKTVNGIVHNYTLEGTKILKEVWGNNILVPLYDNEEILCGIEYNGNTFYFVRNLQNDIIALTDKDGETVARYTYDTWGVCTVAEDTSEIGIAAINPYRYRSYYFDSEIGMYYLQSRYYDPTVGRFVNADKDENYMYVSMVLDNNAFSYTQNNPVVLSDNSGESWVNDLWKNIKNGAVAAWNWIRKTGINIGRFFKNTVWNIWIVQGVWNTLCKKWIWQTFCKKWVWDKFCKEMVYNTFIKKWVWETFCKKWTWNTFCKKWVWQTFCKKWVWETFCKDWIANKAWNWLVKAWYTTKAFVNNNPILGTIVSVLGTIIGTLGLFFSAHWIAVVGFVLTVIGLLIDCVSKY